MMQYTFSPASEQKEDFRRDAAYVIAALSGLKTEHARQRIAGEIEWGRIYHRRARGPAPAMEVEHYTGPDEYHMRIMMNGCTPELEKKAAEALVMGVLGKYAAKPGHIQQANL